MGTKLEVRTCSSEYYENPKGFTSTDECAPVLKAFCDEHDIPYSNTFVSITVSREGINLKKFGDGRTAVKPRLSDLFGPYVLTLKPNVVKEIQVVCAGDFQTTICNAVAKALRGESIREYLSRFTVLSGKTCDEKMAALEKAAGGVPGRQYAEARIHRPLKRSDDVRF
jgi:hypothetical protein